MALIIQTVKCDKLIVITPRSLIEEGTKVCGLINHNKMEIEQVAYSESIDLTMNEASVSNVGKNIAFIVIKSKGKCKVHSGKIVFSTNYNKGLNVTFN